MADLWTPASYQDAQSGYNMPGGSGVEDDRPSTDPGNFWGRVKAKAKGLAPPQLQDRAAPVAAAANAWGNAYAQQRTQRYSTTSPQIREALDQYDPSGQANDRWDQTKWAFRGTHSVTPPFSQAHEQNLYGGVTAHVIPTSRIQVHPIQRSYEDMEQESNRRTLNEEELYPSPMMGGGPQQGAHASAQPPTPMGMPMRPEGPAAPMPMTADPLFAQNTGQGLNVNPLQFNPHQRATTGLRQ